MCRLKHAAACRSMPQHAAAQEIFLRDRTSLEVTVGTGAGLVSRIGGHRWGVAVPLEPWVDNTTGELWEPPSDAM